MFAYRTTVRAIASKTSVYRAATMPRTYLQTPHFRPYRFQTLPSLLHSPQPRLVARSYTTQAEENPSTKQKLKSFMKKYGAVGVGVYLSLSAVDLSLTMLAISFTGAERVKQVEDWVMTKIKNSVGLEHKVSPNKRTDEKPSLWAIFVIAYGIHKTVFLPFRLGLTAAITPFLAKKLRQMGFRVAGAPKTV
ncbi:hypothetical protein INT43_008957 [Umbelopsis isabellina]|uniref:DUF1279 domain-containing protein n=1 Tax=Mortierella isabellina TaxID=91625 RepID=A0A8H7UJL6_MORIS|nr:hypothetical protein INT43_008957 [Umbelopsis isabellina]